jgi:hypothetical protein
VVLVLVVGLAVIGAFSLKQDAIALSDAIQQYLPRAQKVAKQ